MSAPVSLAIDAALPAIDAALSDHGAVVVVAPPGAGKTTRVPPRLLQRCEGLVWVLQPRRLAARATAARMAAERGESLGQTVGYSVRFDRRVSAKTRLEVMTEGLLLRRLQRDPLLEGVDAVVLDEVHERSIDVDLALALLAEVRRDVRPDLKLVVMSATMDAARLAAFLDDAPVVEVEDRRFAIDLRYDAAPDPRPLDERVAAAVLQLDAELEQDALPAALAPGHVLVFLPGMAEIRAAEATLRQAAATLDVRPLHGSLPVSAQDHALAPSRRRKIVLATNVAETSLTIDGVAAVVDSGLRRIPRHDEAIGVDRLEKVRISKASADQRAGRAGRTGPGRCRRLWSRAEHEAFAAYDPPEIARSELSALALQLLAWGAQPETFAFFEAPPASALAAARTLLRAIGAVDAGGLTAIGRACASLPLPPRVARVLVEGARHGRAGLAASVAALSSERDLLGGGRRDDRGGGPRDANPQGGDDDLELRLHVLDAIERGGANEARRWGVDPNAARALLDVRAALRRQAETLVGDDAELPLPAPDPDHDAPAAWLLAGFPDRVAARRESGSPRLLLASGKGATLSPRSVVRDAELLVAVVVEIARFGGRSALEVPVAVPLQPRWLAAEEALETRWDVGRLAVAQRIVARYGAVVVRERPAGADADPDAASALLAEMAAKEPERALSPDDEAEALLARVRWLGARRPALGLPRWQPIGAEDERGGRYDLLAALSVGRRSYDDLRRADVAKVARDLLDWPQRQALDSLAPARIELPSGRSARVDYGAADATPRLSVRLQDAFGLLQTPRICDEEVAVVLELLAPNGRPAQVTTDIAGFWTSSWAEVRRELRGRYPKHAWPEVPTLADARRPRRPR
ncbi:MAG: ATP-dependent helicase HrpB [Deltaproteobacteria bacterium]|nr:ATP-dependent helicase HrpB [Deltaproteobacteria bacterium]